MSDDDLAGGGIITAKSLLLEMRQDVKQIGKNVDLLVGQNLDFRLSKIEDWKDQVLIEGARVTSDVNATPVGRALEQGRIANAARIGRLEKTIWIATGILSAVIFIVNLVAPFVVHMVPAK